MPPVITLKPEPLLKEKRVFEQDFKSKTEKIRQKIARKKLLAEREKIRQQATLMGREQARKASKMIKNLKWNQK